MRLTIHQKLLIGFLAGALLLVGMATVSLVVIGQMHQRVRALEVQEQRVDVARQMLYDVTSQSHVRAMALLRYNEHPHYAVNYWNAKVDDKKEDFRDQLNTLREMDPQNKYGVFYDKLADANRKYSNAGKRVDDALEGALEARENGDSSTEIQEFGHAETLHLNNEHRKSHNIEDMLTSCWFNEPPSLDIPPRDRPDKCAPPLDKPFIDVAKDEMIRSEADIESARAFHRNIVLVFSAASVLLALLLGYLFSWPFLIPVKKMQHALAGMTAGDLRQRVEVPNRDEFGKLSQDLNTTSQRLESSFERQRRLAQRLQESNASLARASEAKSQFLASVSHELRTPLNSILGFTGALLAGMDGPLNQEQRASIGWVERGGNDLLNLIDQLLDLSRIEAGKLTLTPAPFQPVELVQSVVAQQRLLADQKGIGLSYRDAGSPADVVQDPQRVRQILANLIGNAVKLTEEGEVEVTVSAAADGLRVAVRDSGPGIPEHEREAIFQDFYKAQGSERGTGLGLAISRRLARAMGGDISLQTRVGRGSTFQLWLPRDYRTLTEGEQGTATRRPP